MPPLDDAVRHLERYYTDHDCTFGFDKCVSIFSAVEIIFNGDMSPCRDYHDYVVGNVKQNTITEIWNSERYREFRKSLATKGSYARLHKMLRLDGILTAAQMIRKSSRT